VRLDVGATVYDQNHQQLGTISRIVVDPRTNAITHLVIQKGSFLPRDIVVPADRVIAHREDDVQLTLTDDEVDALPNFIESEYVAPPEGWVPPTPYPPAAALWPVGAGYYPVLPVEHRKNVPDSSIEIFEGMDVECSDGKIGTVEKIHFDEQTGEITSITVSSGLLFPSETVIPFPTDVKVVDEQRIVLPCRQDELDRFIASEQHST
jgi:uncharacterized protein YrrD